MDWAEANRSFYASGAWQSVTYRGLNVYKYPTDLYVYAEIIDRVRPEVIVETGSADGGSAAWFAQFADVVSVDILAPNLNLERVSWVQGDSVEVFPAVDDIVRERRALVSLDSDHSAAHVRRELATYSRLVSLESYLVVEDTAIDVFGVDAELYGEGPGAAAAQWLEVSPRFVADGRCDRFLLGMNPGGWLLRVS